MFPNQGVHQTVEAIAAIHPRAIDYLRQAPVIALAYIVRERRHASYLHFLLHPLFESGAPLAAVMARLGIAHPLRALPPSAVIPSARDVVRALSTVDPRDLGNVIPTKGYAKWLGRLIVWQDQALLDPRGGGLEWCGAIAVSRYLLWAARHFPASASRREASDMADFALFSGLFSAAWRWRRACDERDDFHDSITLEKTLANSPFQPDDVIDHDPRPDIWRASMPGRTLSVIALRTPRALVQESTSMRHCVGSAQYLGRVVDGTSRIASIREGEDRLATLELGRNNQVIQLRGRYNAEATSEMRLASELYADHLRRLADAAA